MPVDKKTQGDKILSASGAIFFSALDNKPKSIEEIAIIIKKLFINVDIETIKNDAKEFYFTLEKDKFVVSGKTSQECLKKDFDFLNDNYNNLYSQKSSLQNSNQQEKTPQDFLEEYYKGKPQLTNVHIEITSKCNERCVHCYIPHENKLEDITPNLFYDIVKQCYNMKVLHLTLSGGEPMLHKNFLEFLNECRKYNFSVNILSNLTLLNDEIIAEMKKNPLLGVQVSLYSMDNKIHDAITQHKGSFERTKKSILELSKNNIALQISCPIIKQNKNCYLEVVEWAKKYNIHTGDDYVIIARYDNTTKNLSHRLSISDVRELIYEKGTQNTNYFDQIKLEAEKKDISPDDYICSVCNSSICIADNGNVYPCAGWQGFVLGNVKENPLNDIWINSEKINYLRSLRRRDFSKCVQCADKEFCTMCMVRNANESPLGNPLEVNEYFCNIARLNKEMALKRK